MKFFAFLILSLLFAFANAHGWMDTDGTGALADADGNAVHAGDELVDGCVVDGVVVDGGAIQGRSLWQLQQPNVDVDKVYFGPGDTPPKTTASNNHHTTTTQTTTTATKVTSTSTKTETAAAPTKTAGAAGLKDGMCKALGVIGVVGAVLGGF